MGLLRLAGPGVLEDAAARFAAEPDTGRHAPAPNPGLFLHHRLFHPQGGGGRQAQSGTDRQRGHQAGRIPNSWSAPCWKRGWKRSRPRSSRTSFQYAGQHRPADPDRPAARLQDATEPDPLPALGAAADARRQPALAGSADQPLQRVPGDHVGANGRTPAAGRQLFRRA